MGINNSKVESTQPTERHPDLNKPCPAPNQPFVANQTTTTANANTKPSTIVEPIQVNNASLEASKTINQSRNNKNNNNKFQNALTGEEPKPESTIPNYGSVTNSATTPTLE